ncbi:MAG: penicillin-binding protein 2 [Myxococcota bacterium]
MANEAGSDRLGAGVEASIADRVPLIAAFIIAVFGIFFVRLFQLQVVEGEALGNRARRNSVRTVRLEVSRGNIVDRYGRELATTRPAYGVGVMPAELKRPEQTFAALGDLLEVEPAKFVERLGKPRGRQLFQPLRLVTDLPYDSRTRVESHLFALPGVFTDVRPRRFYVGGDLAAHLLGYIGEIQKQQLELRAYAEYRPGEVIGQSGIERQFQSALRGRTGGRNVVVDVEGRVAEILDEVDPTPGGTVVLTIDRDLQQVAEDAFMPSVLGEPAKRGAVVVMDVRNGDILALVSRPAFDPNSFAGGIDSETWKALTEGKSQPLQDRALSGQYPPGSTYKAFVAAAGLEEGMIDPDETVYCPGSFKLGRRVYRCWKRGGHGAVNLHDALVQSCDVYFYQLGLKLGIDRLAFFANGFNLGRKTGIEVGNEAAGLIPTRAWKERRFSEVWLKGETVSASIGQGYNLTTPIQLAVAFAAIANGGKLFRPRIWLRIDRRDGVVEAGPPPEVLATVPVAKEHLETVARALVGVVNEKKGTGARARVAGIQVAGKTGTAQVVNLKQIENLEEDEIPIKYRDHGWFVAFAPADAPEVVVVALAEHGGHGGSAAGPIVKAVLSRYFEAQREEGPPQPPGLGEPGGRLVRN